MTTNRKTTAMTAFSKTFLQITAERGFSSAWILLGTLGVLGGWLAWSSLAQVSLYEVSPEARIELDASAYPVDAPLDGRVVRSQLQVGSRVKAGDILVEMDAVPSELALKEEDVRVAGLKPELERLRAQIVAEETAGKAEQLGERLNEQEAEHRIKEAQIAADSSQRELERMRELYHEKLIPERDWEKAIDESSRLRAAAETFRAAALRLPQEQAVRDRDRDVRVQRLWADVAKLQDQLSGDVASTTRLGYEVERRRVRAPIDGYIGEAAVLHSGAFLHQGDKVASIVPSGRLQVVAQYAAQAAFGRIRPGQRGILRLQGFPWAEFGTVSTTVTSVAQEIRDGRVRVELGVDPASSFHGHLEHGMPGELEIVVEHISPLSLLRRTAGQWLTRQP